MATGTSPQAEAFVNTRVRPAADYLTSLYWSAKQLLEDWTAGNFAQEITFDASLTVDPISDTDNRVLISYADVQLTITRIQEFVNYMESAGTASLTSPGNPVVLNQLSKVKVNNHLLF